LTVKIAYLTSQYPAVSHTFILREVLALRRLGVEIGTFSIRAPASLDALSPEAVAEFTATKYILPTGPFRALRALAWAMLKRPGATMREFASRVLSRGGAKAKARWFAYFIEGVILARMLTEGQFEHLHCHFGNSGSSTALVAAKVAGVAFSVTCHGSELSDPQANQLPEKLRESAFIVCVSKSGKARLMHACARSEWRKLHVVRCGLPEPGPIDATARSGRIPEILCVGRLSPEKGHLVLLEAFGKLKERGIPAKLSIVGDGPMKDALAERTEELGLRDIVAFTGPLEPAEVARRYRSCYLTVLASFSEGVPVALMESLAHARPVVATNVGGVCELVDDGVNGLVVPPGDPEDLAIALAKLLSEPALADEMGRRGAEKVRTAFNEERSAAELKSLFQTAIDANADLLDRASSAGIPT
jgi:colanic acid/amylovoran biosynthesis glycosyltransferase